MHKFVSKQNHKKINHFITAGMRERERERQQMVAMNDNPIEIKRKILNGLHTFRYAKSHRCDRLLAKDATGSPVSIARKGD